MKEIRTNRPLVMFFFLVMLGIVIWNKFRDNSRENWEEKSFTCSGIVETIQMSVSEQQRRLLTKKKIAKLKLLLWIQGWIIHKM